MSEIALLYTTIGAIEAAEKLAHQMVSEHYATCVNIIPNAISIYSWEGKIERSSECLVIFKTTSSRAEVLREQILQAHPYTTPAILQGNVKTSSEFYNFIHAYCALK